MQEEEWRVLSIGREGEIKRRGAKKRKGKEGRKEEIKGYESREVRNEERLGDKTEMGQFTFNFLQGYETGQQTKNKTEKKACLNTVN